MSDFITVDRASLKLLANRAQLALGSLALVEKQLLDITTVVDNWVENVHHEDHKGQEENSELEFFITPPLEVYE